MAGIGVNMYMDTKKTCAKNGLAYMHKNLLIILEFNNEHKWRFLYDCLIRKIFVLTTMHKL